MFSAYFISKRLNRQYFWVRLKVIFCIVYDDSQLIGHFQCARSNFHSTFNFFFFLLNTMRCKANLVSLNEDANGYGKKNVFGTKEKEIDRLYQCKRYERQLKQIPFAVIAKIEEVEKKYVRTDNMPFNESHT